MGWTVLYIAFGIVALAGGLQGWLVRKTTVIERWMLIIAGLMLVYPVALFDYIGVALIVVSVMLQKARGLTVKPVGG